MSILDQKAREYTRPALETIARRLAKWNLSPDAVTYIGLILTIGVAVLAALGEIRWAGVAYIVAALGDALDGTLARVSGKGSRFGAFLDSNIDRFEESIVFLGLSVYYAVAGGQWEIPLLLLVTVGSLMVSYSRARAEALGVECKVGFMTRVPRVVIMIAGMILDQVFITLIILAVTTLFTSFHRMYHVWKMTGGEAGGWGPVKDPFVLPIPAAPEAEEEESGDSD
ncbi:MAG: CDP-alcohol phosphatidyltransferase family protein [Anaerolineae bacterium]|jgi:CDP-diacylglycerol--glycerol-3-phosphate 3-phosphatidyltransferase